MSKTKVKLAEDWSKEGRNLITGWVVNSKKRWAKRR
jgi:hypothetical protein